MNPSVSILAQQYQLNHALVSAAVKDLPEKHIAERINDIGNSMKWLTGHLATSRYVLMKLLGIDEGCPLGDLFARGAEVKPDNECPSLDEILKVWNDVTGKLDARLEKITDEALATESPIQFPIADNTVLGGIAFLSLHETYHVGQLAYIRRLHGGDGITG